MKAKQLPSGSWRVQVTLDGKRVSVTAETEDEAIFEAMALKTGHKEKKKALPTLGECIDQYIDSKENLLSPKTILVYRQIRNNGLADLCEYHLDELTNQRLQVHVNSLALRRSPKTVQNAYSLLLSVLGVFAPDMRVRVTLPKVQKKIKQLPTVEELMQAIVGSEVELPCLLALWLGLRLSEIRGAKKSDIRDGVLYIHDTIITVGGQHIEKHSTKTQESTRLLTLPEHIMELVKALPADQIYLTTLTGQMIYKKFKRLLEENGLPDMTFHDLRHMNASVMLALGVPDKYAMERGGWSSPHIMKSVYQHTFTAKRAEVDATVDHYFNDILHTKTHTK